jgi:Nif-specific regulatory protein
MLSLVQSIAITILLVNRNRCRPIYHLLTKVSNSEATILIQGENGTGKELVAKAIHYNS